MILAKLQTQAKTYSQLAGLIYLIIAIVGGFSIAYMPSQIIVESNASLTFENLLGHQQLFSLGIAGDIAVIVLEIILTVMIYQLFKNVSTTGISIATYARIAMAIIMGANLINYLIPGIIMKQPEFLNAFSLEQLESLMLLFFRAHKYGEMAWQLFFSIHLFTLGYVIWKSSKTPKWLGLMMLIGGIGYGGDCFIQLIMVNSAALSMLFPILLVLAVIAELWFAFWLLVKGVKNENLI